MGTTLAVAKALLALVTFFETLYSMVKSKLNEEDLAKLKAAEEKAKKATTPQEAADAAQEIDDMF